MSVDDYSGQLTVSRTAGFEESYTIHQADPRVMILVSWIDEARKSLSRWPDDVEAPIQLDGDLLRIHARNQTVVYRLVGQATVGEDNERVYLAEWPD